MKERKRTTSRKTTERILFVHKMFVIFFSLFFHTQSRFGRNQKYIYKLRRNKMYEKQKFINRFVQKDKLCDS